MYKATYQSTVKGGSVKPGNDPRDEEVLDLAKQLARKNLVLVTLEWDGKVIWSRGSWIRVLERADDDD